MSRTIPQRAPRRSRSRRTFLLILSLFALVVLTAFKEPRCCPSLGGRIGRTGDGGGDPTAPPPAWTAGDFGSDLPHNPNLIISVSLAPSVSDWDANLAWYYDNARGAWNDKLGRLTFQNLPLGPNMPLPVSLIVRPGSLDESNFNDAVNGKGFAFNQPLCPTSGSWATVNFANGNTDFGHTHHRIHKICVKGNDAGPFAPNRDNPEPFNFRFLMFMHEMGHLISLPDLYMAPEACLMTDGEDMRFPCPSEIGWVRQHYGTQGGFPP